MRERELEIRQKIDAYIKGRLTDDEIEELWKEFAKNPDLLDILEIEVGVKTIFEKKSKQATRLKSLKKPKWTVHLAAAAVVIFIALIQFFRVETPTEMHQFVVHQIDASQLETADGIRAKELQITQADSLLNLGFQAFINGEKNRALDLYEYVSQQHDENPYGAKAYLNKGILFYNDEKYEQAMESFSAAIQRISEKGMISEKAHFFLGNTFIKLGQEEDAYHEIYEVYKMDGIFKNQSFKLLQKISNDAGKVDDEISPKSLN